MQPQKINKLGFVETNLGAKHETTGGREWPARLRAGGPAATVLTPDPSLVG